MSLAVIHYSIVLSVILLLTLFFSAFKSMNDDNKRTYVVLTLGFLAFLTMFHSINVGNDTPMYTNRFIMISETNDLLQEIKNTSMEPGFITYCFIISRFTRESQVLFTISGLIIYYSLGRVIYNNCEAPGLVIVCLVTMQFFDMYISGLRQTLALAILLFSYKYIKEKRLFPFALIVLLATTFHYTSLLFIVAYPVAHIRVNKEGRYRLLRVLVVLFLLIVVFFGFDTLLSLALSFFPKYRYYIGSSVFVSEPNLAIFFKTTVFLLMLGVPKLIGSNLNSIESLDDVVHERFAICNILLSITSMNASVLGRLCAYFSPFAIIHYANSVNRLDRASSTIIVMVSLILLYLYGLVIVVFRTPAWYSTYPFSFCFG